MTWSVDLLWRSSLVILPLNVLLVWADFRDLPGDYCAIRRGEFCCPGRDDDCTVPILGTLCYCDMFCDRTNGADCCPDFLPVCRGQIRPTFLPPPEPVKSCFHKPEGAKGKLYEHQQKIKENCNWCTCLEVSLNVMKMVCDDKPCVIRPEIIEGVNQGFHGWKASNYSFLWGLTLEEGISRRTGTFKPEQPVAEMHSIDMNGAIAFEEHFDAREKWPGYIQPIRDQGNCGSSWAISTVDVAADRLAIMSKGEDQMPLSAQQLISCHNRRQQACKGGYTDRAWRYIVDKGVVSEECYPYTSGRNGTKGRCEIPISADPEFIQCPGVGPAEKYKSPPPYRIAPNEKDIKVELKKNGPVQAILLVREDFYMYQSGVYSYSKLFPQSPPSHRRAGLHSVRIIGWGVDRSSGHNYWLCANSWGRQWGEDGYFRILRGADESNIEMFVVGAWGQRINNNHHH